MYDLPARPGKAKIAARTAVAATTLILSLDGVAANHFYSRLWAVDNTFANCMRS